MQDNLLKGPYETEIIVHVTDGEHTGKITLGLTLSEPPTQAHIYECLAKAKTTAEANGLRLMNKKEFFNSILRERTGATETYAIPGGNEWDA